MNKYIFLYKENEWLNNWEFSSVVDVVEWKDEDNAFENLKIKHDYIWHSWDYENYSCYELKDWKEKEFNIVPD